jgi:hypothetical protein
MLKSDTSHIPSFAKVEHSTVTSRWICRTISLQVTISTPRIFNRLCIFWISIAKLWFTKVTHSEGTSFAQKGGRGGGNRSISGNGKYHDYSTYDKKYWNDKECYKCHKKGHPATHCPKKSSDDDACSTASAASSVNKLKKDLKSIKKAFTTVNTQLAQLEEADSYISESEGEEASHFQVDQALQFAQIDNKFEPRIAKLFKQAGPSIKLDLKEVILVDIQSTMDLFCKTALVIKTSKSRSSMRLKSNGDTMVVT